MQYLKNKPLIEKFSLTTIPRMSFFAIVLLLMLFGRPFSGIGIFGFRIGEIIVGFSLLVVFMTILNLKKALFVTSRQLRIYNFMRINVLAFFVVVFYHKDNLLDPYVFKTSSYFWIFGIYFISTYFFLSEKNQNLIIKAPSYILIIVYSFTTIKYPDLIHDFLIRYSDKFDFHKGAEILLIFVVANLLNLKFMKKNNSIIYLFLSTGLFLPLFFYMSRGATIACLIFFATCLVREYKFIITNYKSTFIVFIFTIGIFIFSAVNITSDLFFGFLNDNDTPIVSEEVPISIESSVVNIIEKKNYSGILSFYFKDGKIFNSEMNANWRLILWQEIIYDLDVKNLFLVGYGYSEIIPVMLSADNNGIDGTNENVHNHFIQILARGGIIHVFLIVSLYLLFIKIYYDKHHNLKIVDYILPIIFVSLFDTSMESVRFPTVFLFYLAFFVINGVQHKDLSKKIF
jgi:hypothetical protein